MSDDAPVRRFVRLTAGDPAPWFTQHTIGQREFTFDLAAGRYVVLCFFGSTASPAGRRALEAVQVRRSLFDERRACFFGVTLDRNDERESLVTERLPGLRFFRDYRGDISKSYGALPADAATDETAAPFRQFWLVLDPMLRVVANIPFQADGGDVTEVFTLLDSLSPVDRFADFEINAPILVLPRVFEPELCAHLIAIFERYGGSPSGVMREKDGKTVGVHDVTFKSRRDFVIDDADLMRRLHARIERRIVPEILKAFQFRATRMERYIVSCYAAEDRAHFQPHRDNVTRGTAHRRFAITLNLNSDYDGGRLAFPEYGPRTWKAPAGCAIVFATPLMHAVTPVTRGKRYAFLPFLYDEEAARLREANNAHLGPDLAAYRADDS